MTRPPSKVTIHDVAEALGVSKSTVSAALNGSGSLRESTRQRVRQMADELGYRPSRAALAFRKGRADTIALALPTTAHDGVTLIDLEIYMRLASAAALATFDYGNSLVLTPSKQSEDYWLGLGVDGVLLCDPERMDPRIDLLERAGVPTVTIERDPGRPDWPYAVGADHARSMVTLLDHLESQGARRIALVAADTSWSWAQESAEGYRDWSARRGRPQQVLLLPLNGDRDELHQQIVGMLASDYQPDAIVVSAEQYRDGVLQACRSLGLRIPEDILVALGTDSTTAALHAPSLTALDLLPERHAQLAVDLLMRRIRGEAVDGPTSYESVLRVRESTQREPSGS